MKFQSNNSAEPVLRYRRQLSLDGATDWRALHRAYFDEVGTSPAHFLYLAGLRSAISWSSNHGPSERNNFLSSALAEMSERGLGQFSISAMESGSQFCTIECSDSFESFAFRLGNQRTNQPSCAFASGMMAGFWSHSMEWETHSSANYVCWETECTATGSGSVCRFQLGPIEGLVARGLLNPFEQKAARWELLDLGRKLDTSSAQVTSLQSELVDRERAYHTLLDHMNDNLLVLDRDKKVVFCNQAFLESTGMTIDQALGRSPLEWIEPEDLERVLGIYESLLQGSEERATYRFRVRRLNRIVHLESSAMSLIGPKGERLIQSIGRDVTEREQARQELIEAHALLLRKQKAAELDLRVAKLVHESLLPKPISTPDLDVDIKYVPVDRVGGDYCHMQFANDNSCVLTVCDVSGHGMAAALLASRVSSYLQTNIHWSDPLEIVRSVNVFLRSNFADTGLFVTFIAIRIDLETFQLRYCCAGHPGPIVYRANMGKTEIFEGQNLPVGITDDFERHPAITESYLAPGDRLIVYTDGITEAANAGREQLGATGLANLIEQSSSTPLFQLGDSLLKSVSEYRGTPSHDDMTLILLEAKASPKAANS